MRNLDAVLVDIQADAVPRVARLDVSTCLYNNPTSSPSVVFEPHRNATLLLAKRRKNMALMFSIVYPGLKD